MEEPEDVIMDDLRNSITKTFAVPHILEIILQHSAYDFRKKLFVVGRSTWKGDLKGLLGLRLVSKKFNEAVCSTVRKEFKNIQVEIDSQHLSCNGFIIGPHRRPPDVFDNIQNAPDEREIRIEDLPSEDSVDAEFLERFFKWLAEMYEPTVERFTIFESWSFKPCSLPEAWTSRLEVFSSMHPDMQYCSCEQCIQMIRNCKEFGPLSFQMAEDAWKGQRLSYRTVSCTDAFIADVAMAYTELYGSTGRFDVESFYNDFGGIRCENITFAVQTLSSSGHLPPKAQPLEVIQLILRLWEVKSVEFEVIKYMDNDYYVQRTAWETTGAFHKAYFGTYQFEIFNTEAHVIPYQEVGKLDRDLPHECLPIFDLRQDSVDGPYKMSTSLSLLSLVSENDDEGFSFIHQGLIAFHMFRNSRVMFINSSIVDFRGIVGTANWLKFCIREMMHQTWGPRNNLNEMTGKTVYWVHFVADLPVCISRVWEKHAQELLDANFPNHMVKLNTADAFLNCDNKRIAKYDNSKRCDVVALNAFYCTLQDSSRGNITHVKFINIVN